MSYPIVNRDICGYCGACVSVCPNSAIELVDLHLSIDLSLCKRCLSCVKVCPLGALKLDGPMPESGVKVSEPVALHKEVYCDVLVIGGGPAGSMAAKAAAEQNVDVLMVEKRQEIGSPVRCAEGTSKRALIEFIEPDPRWIAAEIDGGRIYAPDGNFVTVAGATAGLVLERKIFDRELAARAAQSGADIWVKSRAVGLLRENNSIAGAIIRRSDGDHPVRAKVVIGADGVESKIGKWAGIDTNCSPVEVDTCAQYLMAGLKDFDPSYCCFYLGHQVAPRGYAWVFPKGKDSANVGIGIGGHINGETAIGYLNKFVEKNISGGSVLAMVAGCVPVAGVVSDFVRDGFMVIGDAAHQNDPVSGGGIINSMIAGQIAGEVAGRAVRNGNVSREVLAEYEKRWHNRVGRMFRHLCKLREGILNFSDETFNSIARVLSETDLNKVSMTDLFWTALKNEPRPLLELRHLIAMGWG